MSKELKVADFISYMELRRLPYGAVVKATRNFLKRIGVEGDVEKIATEIVSRYAE